MSFSAEVKQEVANKIMEGNDARAELSALIQMTSSLSFSSQGMTILVTIENAAVARTIYRLVKERFGGEITLFVKRKMNLKKNRVYGLRILSGAPIILTDLGLYTSRGLLEKPLRKIVETDSNARAYLAGAFLAGGSINPPEKTNYHLEITAACVEQAEFMIELMERFDIHARMIERRGKNVVYVKSAEKIADFLRIIEADQAVLDFENIRISRDFTNNITRLNNIDIANEMKAQTAAAGQLEDIHIIENSAMYETINDKLKDVMELRKEYPDSSLNELAAIYEQKTGNAVSKSGMKHRFVKIHELAKQIAGGKGVQEK
ncbi:MAG: DNA-binding protein WhiA [Bulleidia sp.]